MRHSRHFSSSPAPAASVLRRAVTYARVSSKEQEKEGFSIPAQLKLLRDYAAAERLTIAHEYVDVETAKQAGRANFGEMIAYLKAHSNIHVTRAPPKSSCTASRC
jgi:site-specific DNA recombinase